MFFFTLLVLFVLTSCAKKKQAKPVTKRDKQSESGSDPATGKLTEKTTKTTGLTTQQTVGQTTTTELANFSPLLTPQPSGEMIKQINPMPPITKPIAQPVAQQVPKPQTTNQPTANPQPIVPIPEVRPESDVVASQVRSNFGMTNDSQLFAGIGQKAEWKEQVKPKEAENKEPAKDMFVEKKVGTKKIVSQSRQKKSTIKSKIVLDKTALTETTHPRATDMKTNKSNPLKSKDKLSTEGNIHLSADAEDDETLRNVKSLAVDPDQPPTGD
ncbi:hypothetical protein M3Y96_01038600 [Aphelenchoides besseyi]|nr:hypothetical protein M3Y96_01038600 [Aphelenchoides besseyi]